MSAHRRLLVAPDSFKGSLSAVAAANAIRNGALRAWPTAEVDLCPIADGGEGTVDTLLAAAGGRRVNVPVTGPLGVPVEGFYGLLPDGRAVLEAAAACGLGWVPPERRDVLRATSRGLGELLLSALAQQPTEIIIGLGGSATNDGGAGVVQALGGRLLDASSNELPPGGAALIDLAHIDLAQWRWPDDAPPVVLAVDVANPLCGPEGASAVYGPQKGATEEDVRHLDRALARFAEATRAATGRDLKDQPGAGAAGGLGYGLMAYLRARSQPGIELVLEATEFRRRARQADLVITGEGRIDAQTAFGKAVAGVARAAQECGIPAVALAGEIVGDLTDLYHQGLVAVASIAEGPQERGGLMESATPLLERATERSLHWIAAGESLCLPLS